MYAIDKLVLSHSSRQLLASCARKLEFRKFYECSRRDESLPADAGSALHAGYQMWLDTKDKEASLWAMMSSYPIQWATTPTASRSLEACYATLVAMMNSHQLNGFELVRVNVNGELKPAVEVPFVINITDFDLYSDELTRVPVSYVGFIDLILYNILTDEYIVVDIKTTGRNMADMTPVYRFDDQCLPYALVIDRLIGRPMTQLPYKIFSCFIDLFEPRIKLYDFTKNEAEIHDWTRGLWLDLQLIKTYYESQWFPRKASACTAWNKTCQYFDFCESRDSKTINVMLDFANDREPAKPLPTPWITLDLSFADVL